MADGRTIAPPRPIVFNAPQSARPGDIIYLQGAQFGPAPQVQLAGSGQSLRIVNRMPNWIAAQIPADAPEGLAVRVVNGDRVSDPVWLDSPVLDHFDALAGSASGRLRVFGRNLMLGSGLPLVFVGRMPATVVTAESDAYALTIRLPGGLASGAVVPIAIDNGNGAGPQAARQLLAIVAGDGVAAPFGGDAGWLSLFAPLLPRVRHVPCANGAPVAKAMSEAIMALSRQGGVVQLGAGTCTLERQVRLASNIILQGAGQDRTRIIYSADYPLSAEGLRVIALRDLTLTNAGSVQEGPMLHKSSFVLFQNVTMNFVRQKQSFFDGNRNILVTGCIFNQGESLQQQSPYLFSDSHGLIFADNITRLTMGAAAFEHVTDAYIAGNIFRRDDMTQNLPGTLHMMTIDFAAGIAIIDNIFDTERGPILNRTRNDGESILTEGGGGARTERIGTVQAASANSITDSDLRLSQGSFEGLSGNYGIAIVSGKGAGQMRGITGFFSGLVKVDRPWDVVPDGTSHYATFAWGLERALIRGNSFKQMPRGIWLYQTAIRNVALVGNRFADSGGIYLRGYQNIASGMFDPIYNVLIEGNSATSSGRAWPAYMTAVFVNSDARAFGIGMLGIIFRDNLLMAHNPPLTLQTEEYAGAEGYFAMMRVEHYEMFERSPLPRILGPIFQNNRCVACEHAYRIGTGTGGAVISGARTEGAKSLLENWKTSRDPEVAINTVVE
ncbi:hypothetical protein BH10PSE13_BH10PSE13_05090 [soil metagenome]